MGTRNITRVVVNGERVVNQYGQWDGYPTSMLSSIMHFVEEHDMREFAKKAATSTLVITDNDSDNPTCFTGTPMTDELEEVFKFAEDARRRHYDSDEPYNEVFKTVKDAVLEKYGPEKFCKWQIASRDTGCDVLELLNSYENLVFYTHEYCNEMSMEGDWQIEAVAEVDLDTQTIRYSFHGHEEHIPFSMLNDINDIDAFTQALEEKIDAEKDAEYEEC